MSIERGAKVGPVGRRFDIVPPLQDQRARVAARVLTSIYPNMYIARDQIAFLDKGSEDGLQPGTSAVRLAQGRQLARQLDHRFADDTRAHADQFARAGRRRRHAHGRRRRRNSRKIRVAELRVLRTEKYSSIAIVTQSKREVVSGDLAVSRPGE